MHRGFLTMMTTMVATAMSSMPDIRNTRRKSWMTSKKFEEQLEADKIHAEVLKECIVEEAQEEEHNKFHFQEVLERILQYTPLQVIFLVLAIIDVAIVVSEILVTLHVYDIGKRDADDALENLMGFLKTELHIEEAIYLREVIKKLNRTLHSCNSNDSSSSSSSSPSSPFEPGEVKVGRRSVLPQQYLYDPDQSVSSRWWRRRTKTMMTMTRAKRDADDININANGLPDNIAIDQLHVVEDALNITSIVILGIFVIVAILKMVAEGKHFFKQFMEIIDAFVVTLSFILDIIKYTGVLNKDATEAAIVLLLLWQIVRMFNGIMLSELKRLEFRIKLLKRTRKRVESKASILTNKLKLMEREVDGLRKLSRQRGALEDEIVACRPPLASGKPSALAGLSCIASMSVGLSISTPIAVDLMEQRQCLIQSLSRMGKGPFAFNDHGEAARGLSLVAMYPGDDASSCRSNSNSHCNSNNNQVETEESTTEADCASPKKVHFVSSRADDDDDGDDDDEAAAEEVKCDDDDDGDDGDDGDDDDGDDDGRSIIHADGNAAGSRKGSRQSNARSEEEPAHQGGRISLSSSRV